MYFFILFKLLFKSRQKCLKKSFHYLQLKPDHKKKMLRTPFRHSLPALPKGSSQHPAARLLALAQGTTRSLGTRTCLPHCHGIATLSLWRPKPGYDHEITAVSGLGCHSVCVLMKPPPTHHTRPHERPDNTAKDIWEQTLHEDWPAADKHHLHLSGPTSLSHRCHRN